VQDRTAKFAIGNVVRHRLYPFRGVVFDVDPEFANSEEWWLSIPEAVRPPKDQPYYHLLAENEELQVDIRGMQKSGVVVEACVACANNYGVADDLRSLDIDVKPMGVPLTDRLKGPWKVLTF